MGCECEGPEGRIVGPPGGECPGVSSDFDEVFGNLEGCVGVGRVRGERGVGGVMFGRGVGKISKGCPQWPGIQSSVTLTPRARRV